MGFRVRQKILPRKKIILIKIWLTFGVIYCNEKFSILGLWFIFFMNNSRREKKKPQRDLGVIWTGSEGRYTNEVRELSWVVWNGRQKYEAWIIDKTIRNKLKTCRNQSGEICGEFATKNSSNSILNTWWKCFQKTSSFDLTFEFLPQFSTINRMIFNPINLPPINY